MKHYVNINKLVKSLVLTGVLSVGMMTGGSFTANAAGLDKANVQPVKAAQAKSPLKVQSIVAPPAVPSQPEIEVNVKAQDKEQGNRAKSQASVHANDRARDNANQNSAIFANLPKEPVEAETQSGEETILQNTTSFQTLLAELNGTAVTTGYKYGSDSNSSTSPKGQDIYLGELGYGTTVRFDVSTGSGSYFNSVGANNASYVYGYWFLSGMQKAPAGTSASAWGEQQAKLALQTYESMKSVYGSKVRPVIFIDIESASSGMNAYDYVNNQSVYNAFVNYLNQYGQGVKPGTYSSPANWDLTMGNFSPSTPGAYWVAVWPGGIPSDLTTSNPDWINFPGTNEKAEIWQYYGGYEDYDVAWKLP